jgi:predicted ATPase/DNA-binding winged helix-turn-helix (wHTH) protein
VPVLPNAVPLADGSVDLAAERVIRPAQASRLTGIEARLMAFLAANPHRDISRDELLRDVWGYADGVVSRAVDATVTRLRLKIERDPAEPVHLLTVWGVGYRFEPAALPAAGIEPELDAFFGREDEIAAILAADDRLITLTGPAGIGKTRLAREVGRRIGGACFAAAAEATDAASLSRVVTEALGGPPDRLAGRGPLLLVLDNLEQVVGAAAGCVAAWLRATSELRVIATSRESLRIAGERVFEVGPLDPAAARALFLARAPHELPSEALGPVLARLEGVPLALELAAGLTDILDLQALDARLEQPLDVPSRRRDRPARHASLRAALDGSWASATDGEREVLCAISTLRAPFSAELVDVLCGRDGAADLAGLRARSLVRRMPGGRLALYDAVRVYAEEQRALRPDGDVILTRHVGWFAARAADLAPFDRVAPTPAGIAWIAASLDDLEAALTVAVSQGRLAEAASLAHGVYQLLLLRGPLAGAARALDRVLAHAEELPRPIRGQLHRARANAARMAADHPGVVAQLALGHACAEGDPALYARLVALEGVWQVDAEDPKPAVALLERAVALHQAAGDRAFLPASLLNLANALHRAGAPAARVAALYLDAHRLHLAVGNERSAAIALGNHATILAGQGDLATARSLLEQALAAHRAQADRHHEAVTLGHLGIVALHAGDLADAREMLSQSREIAHLHGGRRGKTLSIESRELAVARHLAGEAEAALQMVVIARADLPPSDLPFIDLLEAAIRIDLGTLGHARALLARHPAAGVPAHSRPMVPAAAGLLALATGDRPAALAALASARALRAEHALPFLQANRLYVALLARRLSAAEADSEL